LESHQKLGVAIVGCGVIGRKRASALPAGSLSYACDLDIERAKKLATECAPAIPVTHIDIALDDPKVKVVILSTTNAVLAPLTLRAVQAGKHVLVEKPGAMRSEHLVEIEAAAAANGALVRIGYNHRFHPTFLKALELVNTVPLGELMFIRGRYGHGGRIGYDREWRADPQLSGGGELIDQGVHLIDLSSLFMGNFTEIEGHATTYFWDMPVDDNAFLSLRTANGKTAWLQVSCTEWKNLFSFEIYFQHAKLQIEGLGGSYGVERLYYYRMLPEMGPPETVIYEFPHSDNSWTAEVNEFLQDIQLGRLPQPGLKEGKKTLEIVEQIYQKSGYR
jgi:predicted dehydrogenase